MVGQTVSHYRIVEKLGEGGMGVVYKAEDTQLRRTVALKFLSSHLLGKEGAHERFFHEARAIAALDHPNICTVHEVGEIGGEQMFLAMAYYEGETLQKRIERGPLAVEEATQIALQLARGLAKAHAEGITHRDLKPGNVMLTKEGLVKILDFGLAKLAGATKITKTGSTVGTPSYMSPEQVEGKDTDPRSDIWSFGTILYEMLAGEPAFKGGHEAAVYYQILNHATKPLGRPDDLPDGLQRIVDRSLVKDRSKRLGSAAEIVDELESVQSELAGVGPAPSLGSIVLRQARRPRVAIPGLAVLLALGVALIWFAVRSSRINWARNVALPEIARLMDEENVDAAFRLAQQAELYIPDDRQLLDLKRHYATTTSISSTPPGADVYVKGYLNVDADWLHLGQTPLDGASIPPGYLRWRVTKDGFAPAEAARYSVAPVQEFMLRPANDTPPGMMPVPGGPYRARNLPPAKLEDYWLDKYEVTNEQFKDFVDQGGYEKRDYWKHPFVKDGKVLSWEEAIAEFRDTTGRAGPATWTLGAYGEGRAQFPVSGVSWYEAAAYAEFAGKSLPTVYHWFRAHATPQASEILRLSNFSGESPAEVGSQSGLSPYGSYDMAGNVREWCWNQIGNAEGGQRSILGASWKEAPYRFRGLSEASPWDRSETNGFRCAKYGAAPPAALTARIEREVPDFTTVKPVSDEVFEVYRSFYSYERTPLEPAVDAVDDTALHWRREKVSFNAAYDGERVIAYLFLPRNAEPPYQTVIYFASGVARQSRSYGQMNSELRFVDFLPRIGRAVLFLVYKGTYERSLDHPVTGPFFTRDLVIAWSRDFSRSIDYLETRPDVDHENLGYFSFSNPFMPIFSAVDGRIKAGAHIGTGLGSPEWGAEFSSVHFAPRAKEPTLLIGGRYDFMASVETSQRPLLNLLGAPEKDKKLALFETGHVVYPGPEMIKEVLDWFDRYLGPVKTTP